MSRLSIASAVAILVATTLPAWSAPNTSTPDAKPAITKPTQTQLDQYIAQLHDQLGITAAQQPQWEQFTQVMRDNAASITKAFARRGARLRSMNATQNMQSYAHLAQVHATNMQKLASAFLALYSSFPDEQKRTADKLFQKNNGMPELPRH